MHAKGSGAFGTFTVTNDVSQYTRAKFLGEVGKRTEMFARFTTVAGERGAADAERDIRGFALKFYTEEGNWDMVGNNTPVFFVRDPRKFPDLNKAVKRDPRTNMRSATNNWDFWTLLPEAFHQVTIVMSDRGIPKSYRHMHGFGSHTYSFYNEGGERFWVKFHFVTQQGIENLTDEEAAAVVAGDRESNQRDLYEAIENGNFPKWKMMIQVMPEAEAETCGFHPFDLTKIWPHGAYPLIEVGEFELNRNPDNFFADVEQSAFAPNNLVPGIGVSPDKMLQSRLFAYSDAQRYRLGVNHQQIPVNAPRCPVFSNHRDGAMRVDGNYGGLPHYQPNSFGQWQDQPDFREPPLELGDFRARGRPCLEQAVRGLRQLVIVSVASCIEKAAQIGIALTLDHPRIDQDRLAATRYDLSEQLAECGFIFFVPGQHMHCVLERHCSNHLQAAPNLHAQVGWLRRKLMEQGQPMFGRG